MVQTTPEGADDPAFPKTAVQSPCGRALPMTSRPPRRADTVPPDRASGGFFGRATRRAAGDEA
ncbi:hypothetical protein [Nocardia arizonensis]|uniref:hypothetical protein n=1 Tax=Nocardia arizonensis TaxID=1141647 RepID=UPI0006D0E005|nr:hypothetical protein [Nocardia arizonensis]